MARRRKLELSPSQTAELQHLRDHDPRAYLRERAGALLKIAAGLSPRAVALHGLLKPRHPDTVYGWLDYYQQHQALKVRPACRRAFSPG